MKILKKIILFLYVLLLKIISFCFRPFFFYISKISLKEAKNKNSLLILCLAKNNAKELKKTLKLFSYIEKYFSNFKVLIYENNSTDNTKAVLRKAKNEFSFVDYFSFDYTQEELEQISYVKKKPKMTLCHIQHIAYGRNFLLEKAKELANDYENILVFDPDVFYFNPFEIVKKLDCFIENDYNVMSVNGLTKMLRYRDAYAFRSKENFYGPEYLDKIWWEKDVHQIQKRYFSKKLIPVYSAFGGAAFYKTQEYITARYSALHTEKTMDINKQLLEENTNYTGAVVCEHVPFHYQLAKNGFAKQYIDTSWKVLFL